jgi:hypothetical protein
MADPEPSLHGAEDGVNVLHKKEASGKRQVRRDKKIEENEGSSKEAAVMGQDARGRRQEALHFWACLEKNQ